MFDFPASLSDLKIWFGDLKGWRLVLSLMSKNKIKNL